MRQLNCIRGRFVCKQLGMETNSLKTALVWHRLGMTVEFHYNGKFIGLLHYAGEFQSEDCLPISDGDYGTVYTIGKDLYICYPDEEDFLPVDLSSILINVVC